MNLAIKSAFGVFLPTCAICFSLLCARMTSISVLQFILIPFLSADYSHLASHEVAHSTVNHSTESKPKVENCSSGHCKHSYCILVVFPLFHPTGSRDPIDIRAKQERLSMENQCGLAAGERSSTGNCRAV